MLLLGGGVSLGVLGCGKPTAAPLTPTTVPEIQVQEAAGDIDPEAAIAPRSWAELEGQERYDYMMDRVMPAMAQLFQSYDGTRFAHMGCDSCHGTDGKERHYKMPSPSLVKLNPKDDFRQAREKHPGGVEFMMQEVVPTMSALLDKEPYNPSSGQGFGCFACHEHAQN